MILVILIQDHGRLRNGKMVCKSACKGYYETWILFKVSMPSWSPQITQATLKILEFE